MSVPILCVPGGHNGEGQPSPLGGVVLPEGWAEVFMSQRKDGSWYPDSHSWFAPVCCPEHSLGGPGCPEMDGFMEDYRN